MIDPATRERVAREKLVADLIRRERHAREELSATRTHAALRRDCLRELHRLLGTWQQVADATGQNVKAIQKAAYKRPQEGTT